MRTCLVEEARRHMSDHLFNRIAQLLREGELLREFNFATQGISERELELEYESLTGMECDLAAARQSKPDFVATVRQAIENIKKRKKKLEEPLLVGIA
jgi:macrodomain Ter protein organizer (MatP/YcbG family)